MKTPVFDRHTFPPGGWQFIQPQTKWKAPTPTSSTFDQTVGLIIKHRMGNPAIAQKYNLSTSKAVVEAELENYTRQRLGLASVPVPKTVPPPVLAAAGRGGLAAEVRKAAVGIGTMADWVGEGLNPVSAELAERRAARCVECPHNSDPNWIQRLEAAAAEKFRRAVEAKKTLNLRTSHDAELLSCQVCNCHLPLKVWVPENVVKGRLNPGELDALRNVLTRSGKPCWMINPE